MNAANEMNVQSIEINKIMITDNSRLKLNDSRMAELMQSMKTYGLKQPVGVAPNGRNGYYLVYGFRRMTSARKLGWTHIPAVVHDNISPNDHMLLNLTENMVRKDLTIAEIGRISYKLQQTGLTTKEISVKLGVPFTKIKASLASYKSLPKKHRDLVEFASGYLRRQGTISGTMLDEILRIKEKAGLNEKQTEELVEASLKDNLNAAAIAVVGYFMQEGLTISKAVKEATEFQSYSVNVIVHKDTVKSLADRAKVTIGKYLPMVFYGEFPPIPKPEFLKDSALKKHVISRGRL